MPQRSMYDLVKDLRVPDADGKISPTGPGISDGLRPEPAPKTSGVHCLVPAQILDLWVDAWDPRYADGGYQREVQLHRITTHLLPILARGRPLPYITVGLYDDRAFTVDGQQRSVTHLIVRKEMWAVFIVMTRDEARQLYSTQASGRAPSATNRILVADGLVERYLQAACGSKPGDNPWSSLVNANGRGDITVASARDLITGYVTGRRVSSGAKTISPEAIEADWDPKKADELALLLGAFGDRKSHRAAFGKTVLRGITNAAVRIMPEDPHKHRPTITRWNQMARRLRNDVPAHIVHSAPLVEEWIILHWNARPE